MTKKSVFTKLFSIFSILVFASNALASGSYVHGDHMPSTPWAHHHYQRSSSSSSTTPFDITIVDGTGHIKQFGNVTIIWISSPNAVVEGNISTNLGDIVKIFMKASGDTTVLESNTGFTTFANGHYYSNATLLFLNTAGIVFGPSSQVKAANEIVSTLNISNADLLTGLATGKYNFTGQGTYIINNGKLIAQPGGYIALLSGAISNQGMIKAKLGKIVLASGDGMTLTTVALDDKSTIFVAIDKAVADEICDPNGDQISNAINNSGTISANGGTVTLTAKTLNTIFDHSINNSGIIEANSLSTDQKGDVVLKTNGDVLNSGTIQADNITIKAKEGIYSTGSLIDSNYMKLLSQGPIYSLGVLKSSHLFERGATFKVGGVFDPGVANVKNADHAMEYTENVSVFGDITDPGDIIIDPGVTLTLTADTTFSAGDSFDMESNATATSAIDGGGYTLSISGVNYVTIGNISNVSSLTATAGQAITQTGAISTNNGNYNATAPTYDLYYDPSTQPAAPSISTGTGTSQIIASTIMKTGPGWGFTSDTSTAIDWTYLGAVTRGYSLIQFGYYFYLGGQKIFVPFDYTDPTGDIRDNPGVSGTQTLVNIGGGGGYVLMNSDPGVNNPATMYYLYTDPSLNQDQGNQVNIVSATDEAAYLAETQYGGITSYPNQLNAFGITNFTDVIPVTSPEGEVYNWEDTTPVSSSDQDYNDVIVQINAVTSNALIISANNQSKTYGAALPNLTVSYAGFLNGDSASSLSDQPSVNTTATSSSDVGNYVITASGAVDPNYSIFYVPGSLTITPASATITANNQTTVYGTPTLPNLTYNITGLVNGDTSSNLSTQPSVTTTATPTSNVGNYGITASGAVDPNYTFTYVPGTLSVTPASATITANNQTTVYGTPTLPNLTYNITGLVNGDTSSNLSTQPSVTTTATPTSNVGNYGITASGAVDPNYTFTYVPGTLSVTPASATITANNQTTVYGTPTLPNLTVSITGLVNGDTSSNLTTQPTVTTTGTPSSNAGNYAITASGAIDSNYTFTYVPGTLSVTPASATITVNNQTTVVGTPTLPNLTYNITGLVNGDTSSNLTTQPTVTTTATPSSNVGNYAITASGAVDPNYNFSYVAGTLSITPAGVTPAPPGSPSVAPAFNAFGVLDTNNKVNKIIYETLSPYQLSTNTVQQPLVYFYHPLTPIDQSAFDGISLDEGAYDFIENSLQLNKAPSYYGVQ